MEEIKSLLAALFLHLIEDENGLYTEAFVARYDSSVITDIAKKLGHNDLVKLFDKLTKAYEKFDCDDTCDEEIAISDEIKELTNSIEELI